MAEGLAKAVLTEGCQTAVTYMSPFGNVLQPQWHPESLQLSRVHVCHQGYPITMESSLREELMASYCSLLKFTLTSSTVASSAESRWEASWGISEEKVLTYD